MASRVQHETGERSGSSGTSHQEPVAPSGESVRAELQKILESEAFSGSERLSHFLRFVVEKTIEGRGDEVKEYLIGVEVYGREESFDPSISPIVRVEARRLRSALKKYFESEGRGDPVRIDLPKGSYVPVFLKRRPPQRETKLGPKFPSIVVLPFENLSPEADQEYFCDGITEEIIAALTQLSGLHVVARTSAFAFKGKHQDIKEIGEELGVSTVLEGSVRKAGNRLRVTTQLTNVADGYHLWSDRYDREMKDVFAIQDDISWAIVNALRVRLGRGEGKPLRRTYTDNLEAYNLYLKGRYYWNQQTPEGVHRGCRCFEWVIASEPNYALAHAAVSDCYRLLGLWGALAPSKAWPESKTAWERALSIDDDLAEAHNAAGSHKALCEWDWSAAKQEFERAMQLNPNYGMAHQAYAMSYLAATGRTDEAVLEMERAVELDPLSPFHCTILGLAYHFARRYDDAVKQYQKTLEIEPRYPLLLSCLGWSYEQTAKLQPAIDALQTAKELVGSQPMTLSSLGHCYGLAGNRSKAEGLLVQLERLSRTQYVSPFDKALIHTGLGERDLALNCLEQACEEYSGRLIWLKVDPRFDNLRTDPRFSEILRTMGLGPG